MGKERKIQLIYWGTFVLSVFTLLINFGIILISIGLIFFLPALILHFKVGLKLKKIIAIKNGIRFIITSCISLLLSSLFRVDGVHIISDNGLSALLKLFGFFAGFKYENVNQYFLISFVSLVFMITSDIILLRKIKNVS